MYKPVPLGKNTPQSMLKVLTKLLQVYHHLAAIAMLSSIALQEYAPEYWIQFWGSKEEDPSVILGNLYDYYNNFVPLLWTSFQHYYVTANDTYQDFGKCLNWFQQRTHGNVFDIQRATDRLQLWIGFMEQLALEAVEVVIPTSHPRYKSPQLKLQNWRLPVLSKSVAIIGDSNLARIEPFAHTSCQVESFPGARIEHMAHLFANYVSREVPTILIFSIGINDATRNQNLRTNIETIVSNLPLQFKDTKKFFVQLQVSPSQPAYVHEKAHILNRSVPVDVHLIPGLPCFETGGDNVHWTAPCANALIQHWLNHIK